MKTVRAEPMLSPEAAAGAGGAGVAAGGRRGLSLMAAEGGEAQGCGQGPRSEAEVLQALKIFVASQLMIMSAAMLMPTQFWWSFRKPVKKPADKPERAVKGGAKPARG